MTSSLENITALENWIKQIQEIVSMLKRKGISKRSSRIFRAETRNKPMEDV